MIGGSTQVPGDGLALVIDLSGDLLEVLEDTGGLLDRMGPVTRLVDLVDDSSSSKLVELLGTASAEGAAFEWELRAAGSAAGTPLRFSAARTGERLLVVITGGPADEGHLTGEMLRINNEQLNTYRSHLKDVETNQVPMDALNELTRLNNELANAQRELAKANRQLADLNEEKDRFLGMAAHELRSPLGVLGSFAQFLDEEVDFDEEQRRMISTIRRTISTMRDLVDDLLDVAAIEAGRLELVLEPVDLVELAGEVLERHGPMAARKDIDLRVAAPDEPVLAMADPAKLVQVLDNLVINALKFTHPGGAVTIGMAASRPDDPTAGLSVTDDGVGIPEERIDDLFSSFGHARTGTGGERGTGLGLAIAKRIVDGHGGEISLASEVGRGTTVTVRLPR